jgi:hypothetical protein
MSAARGRHLEKKLDLLPAAAPDPNPADGLATNPHYPRTQVKDSWQLKGLA